MYVFGGQIATTENTNQFLIYSFTNRIWKHFKIIGESEEDYLPKLDSHSMVVDKRKNG